MDIQKLNKNRYYFFVLFTFLVGNYMFVSCAESVEQIQKQIIGSDGDTDLRDASKQLYEYEQFVNHIWQELNHLSDNMSDLQINREGYSYKDRRTRMTEIEKKLKDIEKKLSKVNHVDKNMINELKKAINRKDKNIKELKRQIKELEGENLRLNKSLEERELSLNNKQYEINRLEAQHKRTIADSYEGIGDALRWSAINIGAYHGTGNLKKVKEAQLKILDQSIFWYEKAYKIRSTDELKNKIYYTINGRNKYRNSNRLDGLNF